MSPSHAPINPPIINLNLEHIDLNFLIVNLSEGDVSAEEAVEEVEIVDLELPLTIYDPLFQDILVEKDAGDTSSEEEAQLEKEVELLNVLHNVIMDPMNVTFKEMLLENVVMKDQIASLNTQVYGLEATVSTLNSTVVQLSSTLTNLTSLMMAHSNQSHHIVDRYDKWNICTWCLYSVFPSLSSHLS
uniref:Uncharacterized protein n=1 Tax=Cucumis melo TaxID=3656 RepID=A0A9I9CXK8_CUCME